MKTFCKRISTSHSGNLFLFLFFIQFILNALQYIGKSVSLHKEFTQYIFMYTKYDSVYNYYIAVI